MKVLSLLFAISSLGESLLAIAQYFNQGSLNSIFYFLGERTFTGVTPGIANADIGGALILRPYATFPHPNVLAGYLLLSMVLVWNFVVKNTNFRIQVFGYSSLVISSVALLLTFSRVAILIWGMLLLFVLSKMIVHSVKHSLLKAVASLTFVIILVLLGSSPLLHDVVLRFSHTSLSDESVTQRTELLRASITIIQHHPFFGVGLNNFIPALAPLQKPMPLGLYLQPVHNIFVLVFAETGIFGFALFMWLLIATVQKIKGKTMQTASHLVVLLLIIIITGLFDHYWLTLQQGQLLFATIIGLSWTNLKKS